MSELSTYLNAIGRVPMLSPAEEVHLGTAVREWLDWPEGPEAAPRGVQRAGRRAKDRMIQANLRLVVHLSRKYVNRAKEAGLDQMDLIQEGTLGLIRGVEKFDPARGYKFSTYGYWWIRQGMTRGLAEKAGLVRIPVHQFDLLSQAKAETQRLTQELGRTPRPAEVFDSLGFTKTQIASSMAAALARSTVSLDQRCENGEGSTLLELVAGETEDPLEDLDRDLAWKVVQAELDRLNEKELLIVNETMLLDATHGEVGEALGVTRSAVSAMRKTTINKLRASRTLRALAA